VRALLKTLARACASLLAVVLCLEAGLLSARYWRDGTFEAENSYDAQIGWVPTPNYRPRDRQVRDLAGNVRSRHYSTNEFGARLWGTYPGHTKVLFIGDSGTQASEVSDDQTYYYHFAQLSGLDTYAIGAGSYGTLQEKMLLERTLRLSEMTPDILVLQFCNNDFMNNSATLEEDSIALKQRIRPYRDARRGDVYTLGANWVFVAALRWSAVFRTGLTVTENALGRLHGGYSLNRLSPETRKGAYDQATQTTGSLLIEMKKVLPYSARAYAFNCSEEKLETFDQNAEFIKLSRVAGFTPLMGARRFIDNAPGGRFAVLAGDSAHLNAEGHQRLAEFLVKEICAVEACFNGAQASKP
jgi:lysophospholipase L1-like esterase